jgi:hypothetical protein
MTTPATARCCAAYAPPSPKPRSAGPDFAAYLDLGGAVESGHGCLELGELLVHALDERLHEPGVVEELAHLVDLDLVAAFAEPDVGERVGEVLAILAAARVRAVRARGDGDELRVPGGLRLGERIVEVRVPVAVAPEHRQADAAARELGLERGLQLAVVLVDGTHAAEMAVVVRDLFEPLVGDAAAARDVAEERDHVVLPLGPAEAGEEDRVIRGRLGDVRRASLCGGRRARHDGARGAGGGCRGGGFAPAMRRARGIRDGGTRARGIRRSEVHRRHYCTTSTSSAVEMRRPV